MSGSIQIGGRVIGEGKPCCIIAEAGVNHNGDVKRARRLVDAAVEAGADAVKFQSFITSAIVTGAAPKAAYQKKTTGGPDTQANMLSALELSRNDQAELFAYALQKGIEFMSSPFDLESAQMLKDFGISCVKVSSGCITYRSLLEKIGAFGLPVILSTGMASMEEISKALDCINGVGGRDVILLQCVTDYPADIESVNLKAMQTMGREFGVLYGYSDHTQGDEAVLAAVALGACVIEKHITLDRADRGPDHSASMIPEEFGLMVKRIRRVESALGSGVKLPTVKELENMDACRYSVVVARPVKAGSVLCRDDLTAKRPGTGIAPAELDDMVGRVVKVDIQADSLMEWDMLEKVK